MLVVGRGGCSWADEAAADYGRRVRRWGGIDEEHVKAETFRGDVEAVRRVEGERILRAIGDRERIVALDERGRDLDSPALTELVEDARQSGSTRLVFVIGGAYGLSPEVRTAAHAVVRLSSLVLNHEVARVVLYEQVYRTLAAIHGVPYAH